MAITKREPAHLPVSQGDTRPAIGHRRRWRTRAGITLLIALYLGLWAFTALQHIGVTDFDAFFLPSARIALNGHPFDIYQVLYDTYYPNANGPLSILPLTLLAWVAQRIGWLDNPDLRRALITTAFTTFTLLFSREAVRALDRLRATPLRGVWRLLAYAALLLTPELWHSVLLYGHIEEPLMLWLTLLGVRALEERRPARAGIFLGLALLTRSTAALYLLVLALTLLFRGRWRACLRFVPVAGVVTLLGVLPFYLADPTHTIYSLVTYRGRLVLGGGNFWLLTLHTPWEYLALHFDSLAVILAVGLVTAVTLLIRRDLDVHSRDIYALLALASLCFPLLMKTLWPYYFLDVYIFATIWWLAYAELVTHGWRGRLRWALGFALPLGAILCGEGSEYLYSMLFPSYWTPQTSVLAGSAVLALLLAQAVLVWRASRTARMLPARPHAV
ncbi:MAG: hypothetical protein OJF49_003293 [Ktedonobacterales bacterium]|nr:MAG: hypothetical protein OJF49_003293 [Ktedonobacterales bacterium]